MPVTPAQLLDFWFRDDVHDATAMRARIDTLFTVDVRFDTEVREFCGALAEQALDGALDSWSTDARGALALLILLDQVPRNIYRGTARAFTGDAQARCVADGVLRRGLDTGLALIERVFIYMPFAHAEDLGLQERCVAGYEALYAVASPDFRGLLSDIVQAGKDHRELIRHFGRFPHRNALLGRVSTPAEHVWLADNRGGWGQGAADLEN